MHELKEKLFAEGGDLVGFADLTCLPSTPRRSLPRAVSIAVALDAGVVDLMKAGPTLAYIQAHKRVYSVLAHLERVAADWLRSAGYQVLILGKEYDPRVDGDGSRQIPHKTIGTLAGVGWIGCSDLLVTPGFGSAIRLASVLTDGSLPPDPPVRSSRCSSSCLLCVKHCRGLALSGERWAGKPVPGIIDVQACRQENRRVAERLGRSGSGCNMCMAHCPFTRAYVKRAAGCGTQLLSQRAVGSRKE